jgi:hypothetical protein
MADPFQTFERQVRRRLRRRRRVPLLVAVAVLALTATATAAAIVLDQEPSKPLKGRSGSLSYRIAVRPDLTAGNVGWCYSVVTRSTATEGGGGGNGCGPAGSTERAVIGGIGFSDGTRGVTALIVDGRAASVKVGARTIATRTDPGLPAGWKMAVFTGLESVDVTPLDAQGRALPNADPATSWAAGRHRYPVRTVDAADPPDTPCAIRAAPLPELRAVRAKLLKAYPAHAPADVREPAFLACSTSVFYLGRTRLRAAVLVNALDHTARAADLPPNFQTTARRVQQGWLVLFGGTPSQRKRVLAVLTTRT